MADTTTRPAAAPTGQEAPALEEYQVIELIGRGGMASVYLARHVPLDRLVALKELALVYASDPHVAPRFVQESRLSGALSHPNVVTVYDYFESRGVPYIAMEYLPRGSLRPLVGALTPPQVIGILEGVLAGMAAASEVGIVHCDLKPENLLVAADGRVKIADFGIAQALHAVGPEGRRPYRREVVFGTPVYMAPEQAQGHAARPSSDLYSVGVIAYETLARRLPFPTHDRPAEVLRQQIEDAPDLLEDVRPDLDLRLAGWVAWLMAKQPHERPASARAAWDALEDIAVDVFGPRWRREAALLGAAGSSSGPRLAGPAALTLGVQKTVRPGTGRLRRRRVLFSGGLAIVGMAAVALLAAGGDERPVSERVPQAPAARSPQGDLASWTALGDALEGLTASAEGHDALIAVRRARRDLTRDDGTPRLLAQAEAAYLDAVDDVLRRGWSRKRIARLGAARKALLRSIEARPASATEPLAQPRGVDDLRRWAQLRAPVHLELPGTVRASSTGGPVRVSFRVEARRAGRPVGFRCRPRSASLFPIGTTRVVCVAGSIRSARRSFRVIVARRPPPTTTSPATTRPAPGADSPQGAVDFE